MTYPTVLINEFAPNPQGTDPAQATIELKGRPGAFFSGIFLTIENDAGAIGAIDRRAVVSGTFDDNGLLVAAVPDLENPSFTAVLLHQNPVPAIGTDLDANDDGTLDDPSVLGYVYDAIGIADNNTDAKTLYATQLGGANFVFTGDEPQLVFRDSESNDWYAINDPAGGIAVDIDGNAFAFSQFSNNPETASYGVTNPIKAEGGNPGAPPLVQIHDIQGDPSSYQDSFGIQDGSPLEGHSVTTEGIVTAVHPGLSGFFVQEEDADQDDNPLSSEAIFVLAGSQALTVTEGDQVRVTGAVDEYFGMTQIDNDTGNLAITVLAKDQLALVSPTVINRSDFGAIDDQLAFEAAEGMLVQYADTLTVAEYFQLSRFGEVVLFEGGRPEQFTQGSAPDQAAYDAHLADLQSRKVIIDDGNSAQNPALNNPELNVFHPADAGFGVGTQGVDFFRGGDEVASLSGVLNYSFGNWKVQPLSHDVTEFTAANPRDSEVLDAPEGSNLRVATFNVLNYFTTIDDGANTTATGLEPRGADSDAELARQRDKIVAALAEIDADVIGLVELENDNDAAIADLVAALNEATGKTYSFIATGVVGGDAVKQGIIYDAAAVEPVGDVAILETSEFLDPNNTGIDKNRPAIAQSFTLLNESGDAESEAFTVVVNHLKSKGPSGSSGVDADQGDGQGAWADTRAKAAEALMDWLATDPTGEGGDNVLVLGDLNAYAMEDAIQNVLVGADGMAGTDDDFVDLLNSRDADAYSYLFDGQLGTLDYILGSSAMNLALTQVQTWQINADEVNLFDYNDTLQDASEASFEAKPDGNELYAPDAYRSSDHDPVIADFVLPTLADEEIL